MKSCIKAGAKHYIKNVNNWNEGPRRYEKPEIEQPSPTLHPSDALPSQLESTVNLYGNVWFCLLTLNVDNSWARKTTEKCAFAKA